MTEKTIYLIGGLGADKRVFQFIDLHGFQLNFLEWISPEQKEGIEHYAQRLLNQIQTPRPIILGVSFGGIMAIEISKLIETEKVIIVSSVKTRKDIPLLYRLIGKVGIIKIFPIRLLKRANAITFWLFGVKSNREKELLKEILNDTDESFLGWALTQIVNWDNATVPANLIHIHGRADRILPLKVADVKIAGGHLMIMSRGREVSQIILKSIVY